MSVKAVAHANKLISIAPGESLCAVLVGGVCFGNAKVPLRKWFQAANVLAQAKNNVSGLELHRHLGVCYKPPGR